MNTPIRHVLLVSRDPAFSAACAKELESDAVRVETSGSAEEARDFAAVVPPDIIVLEETGLLRPGSDIPTGAQALEVAARLAALAPLVVVATAERQSQIGGLLATGAADFVARAGEFLPVACSLVERRLRLLTEQESAVAQASQRSAHRTSPEVEEDFGEVLRHELNNPLTGILGNAELLLAEVRRRNDRRLPQDAVRRLETITDLAVRLRETVRRLSQAWEARHDHARSA